MAGLKEYLSKVVYNVILLVKNLYCNFVGTAVLMKIFFSRFFNFFFISYLAEGTVFSENCSISLNDNFKLFHSIDFVFAMELNCL